MPEWAQRVRAGRNRERPWFSLVCGGSTWLSLVVLVVLMLAVSERALNWVEWLKYLFAGADAPKVWLDWQFLTSFDSRRPEQAGMLAGILGTLWVISLTMIIAIPVGVGAAIYLEEFATDNWLTKLIRINLANLAGVPSIVYGMLGLTVFVQMFGAFRQDRGLFWSDEFDRYLIQLPFGRTVISGSLTLALLILPIIIVAAQEALRAVPPSLRHASLALGATRWQTIRHQTLPASSAGIITGIILALSRAVGETAPLIMVGAASFVMFAPGNIDSLSAVAENPEGLVAAPFDSFVVMPIQVYSWINLAFGRSDSPFSHLAAAGILVLLFALLVLNGLATFIRYRFEKYNRW